MAYRRRQANNPRSSTFEDGRPLEYTSIKNLNESKNGFWGVVARKARAIIDDDNAAQQAKKHNNFRPTNLDTSNDGQYNFHTSYQPPEGHRKIGSPVVQQRLDALANSLNYIGGKVGNAVEEGISIVENRTANIIQETRKINIRRKGSGLDAQSHGSNILAHQNTVQNQNDQEAQLKASRDVANAMAAKAKLLLRELKTVKADLAFAKERSSQLEEENKMLRERHDNQDQIEDDDLMSLQLESLLAEKARLAQENSTYARENRFLREIVEYHQLTMQDVVYLDEGNEEVTEVYPTLLLPTFSSPATPTSPYPCPLTPQPSIKMASSPQPLRPSSSPSFKTTSLEFSSAQGASSAVPTSESVAEVVSEENTKNTDACSKDLTDGK